MTLVAHVDWQERERRFDAGDIDVCWICGLPYVWKADSGAAIELLGAPVMQRERYGGRPVYFSDVVTRSSSGYESFAQLRGVRWGCNEQRSHSGYQMVRTHMAALGMTRGFFGTAIETGSHESSLRMILDGAIDAAVIDSTVLETEIRRSPFVATRLRILASIGPSPIPPWVVHRSVDPRVRVRLREAMLTMDTTPAGRALLEAAGMVGLARVSDGDYDPIRTADRHAPLCDARLSECCASGPFVRGGRRHQRESHLNHAAAFESV